MATVNPFDLLDVDAEDPSQIVAAKPLKVEKPAPVQPAKSVREAKNAPAGGRGGDFGRGRGRGGGFNRDSRNNEAPATENGYGGRYRPSEEGDGARRGGPVGGYHGGRGGFRNGNSGDLERPRRNFERHSGTGHDVTEESKQVVEKNLVVEKQGGEDEATDANKETPVHVEEKAEKEPEDKEMTLEEYEKVLEEKKKALQATKIEERKVDTKAFESMQQLSSKKSNNDDVFIKLGTEKDKRITEKEEKAKKSLSINEFLKPADGESYNRRGGYRGGRGGRGPRGGAVGGGAVGGGNQRNGGAAAAAPVIEDSVQFPNLGK